MLRGSIRWIRSVALAVFLAVPIAVFDSQPATAATFVTPCTGVRWTLADLDANSSAVGPRPGGYDLLDNVTVCAGDTVAFESGAGMWARPGTWIRVEGVLEAIGVGAGDIYVTADDPMQPWAGFQFETGAVGRLANCTIYKADVAILARGAQVDVRDCEIGFHRGGLWLYEGSRASLNDSVLIDHYDSAILANGSSLSLARVVEIGHGWGYDQGVVAVNGGHVSASDLLVEYNQGGGISVVDSRLDLVRGNVTSNPYPGDGLIGLRSTLSIQDTVFSQNRRWNATVSLGNVRLTDSVADFANVTLKDANIGIWMEGGTLSMEGSTIVNGTGGLTYPYGIDCSGGSAPARVALRDTRFVDSSAMMGMTCDVSMYDSIVERGVVQVGGNGTLERNRFVDTELLFSEGLRARDTHLADCDRALVIHYSASWFEAARLDNTTVSNCRVGLEVNSDATVILGNSTFAGITESIVDASSRATVFFMNTTVPEDLVAGDGSMYLGNFLEVRALDSVDIPVSEADVVIRSDWTEVWRARTPANGRQSWMPAPSTRFDGDAFAPVTVDVSVTKDGLAFENSPRTLEMSAPRIEVFRVDRTAPRVLSVEPLPGATGVPVTSEILIRFDDSMDIESVRASLTVSGEEVKSLQWADGDLRTLAIILEEPLKKGRTYTVTVSTEARDKGGNRLEAPYTWSFTTEPPPFYETGWFLPVVIVGVIAMVAAIAAVRMARRRGRRRRFREAKFDSTSRDAGKELPPPPSD